MEQGIYEGVSRNEKKLLFLLAENINKYSWVSTRDLLMLTEFNPTSLWRTLQSLRTKNCIEKQELRGKGMPLRFKLNRFGRNVYLTLRKMEK